MKVFLDDTREAPKGFRLVRSAEQAIRRLRTGRVRTISLDHDLGTWPITGYDVVQYMTRTNRYPGHIIIHTANPLGRYRMVQWLIRHKPESVRISVVPLPWTP